jgi:hypothetical protein
MLRNSRLRQLMLGLAALVFLGIAVASVIRPHYMAEGLGYRLESVDALNEFRAIYVGLWSATAFFLVVAARRVREALLGDLAAVMILGQVVGRILSLVLDGTPSAKIWPFFLLELLGGLALLLVRPDEVAP